MLNIISHSVQFSRSVTSDSLWPHGLQHAKLPCPSPTLGVYSNSCPLCQWCHPTISPSVVPVSSLLPSIFPSIRVFSNKSVFFALGGQSIGVSASVSVLPMNIQDWFPLGLISWISLQSKGLSRVFSIRETRIKIIREMQIKTTIEIQLYTMEWIFLKKITFLNAESYLN